MFQSVGQYVPEGKQKLAFGSFRVSSSLLQTERYFVLKKLTIYIRLFYLYLGFEAFIPTVRMMK
jgi:hypothetical protein